MGEVDDVEAGARAAVMSRLWGGLAREPIEGIARREHADGLLTLVFGNGARLSGPASAAEPFHYPARLVLALDGVPHDDPGPLMRALPVPGTQLADELDNSVANLALARARHRPAPDRTLADYEQSIVDGHPLHPGCRTRLGMTPEDVLKYAPEHRPVVDLHVVEVAAGHWHTSGVPRPPRLPVHPWQLARVLASGVAHDTGRRIPARPLMSLRTLVPVRAAHVHLKTAVDVQMTSAVRTLSAAAIHNGPLASALLAALARRTSGLTVLREPSAASVVLDGEPQRSMGAVWREAPTEPTVIPLAVLADRGVSDAFFAALVELMLPPLLTLLRLGVALEAHGQNTLVAVEGGRPVRLLYRDVGGIHVSGRRLARAGVEMPPLIGAVPTDDPEALRTKLFAAAVATVLNSLTVGAPRRWDVVAAVARRCFADGAGARDDEAAFFGDTLPLKATTAMRLSATPLDDTWARLPNPMR
jgi:staphyloferrin A synthase